MTYKIALIGNGVICEDGRFIPNDVVNADWRAYQAWLAAGNAADPATPISAAPLALNWLSFMALFTLAEQQAIALSVDPDVAVFRMMATGLGGDLILADPRVAQGLQALVAANCIAATRPAQILAGQAPF